MVVSYGVAVAAVSGVVVSGTCVVVSSSVVG